MLKRTVIIFIILISYSINVYGDYNRNIEIFDITHGKVVKVVKLDSKIQGMAIDYIHKIKGIYGKFNPIPENGYAIAIPIDPSVNIKCKWITSLIGEVIIMFPEGAPPFLVIIDQENKLVCFSFKGDTDKLLKDLDFQIN